MYGVIPSEAKHSRGISLLPLRRQERCLDRLGMTPPLCSAPCPGAFSRYLPRSHAMVRCSANH